MEKKLYIEIESGEESYFFTVPQALQLLKEECDRVAREGRTDEIPYLFGFKFLTEDEYKELSDNSDRPIVELISEDTKIVTKQQLVALVTAARTTKLSSEKVVELFLDKIGRQ